MSAADVPGLLAALKAAAEARDALVDEFDLLDLPYPDDGAIWKAMTGAFLGVLAIASPLR